MKKTVPKKLRKIESDIDRMRIRIKDSDRLKVRDSVFDEATLKALYTLSNEGTIEALGGPVSTGKEANVFLAEGKDQDLAVKIYRITTGTFKAMEDYIRGDPRFTGIGHKKKDIVFAWTRKEFSNLRRAREAGVAVPEPIATHRNILVMQFLGENEIAYPLLKDTRLENEEAKTVFYRICNYMRLLYKQAKLVHGDLSEYNILINPSSSEPYIIDMGQAVTPEHPGAEVFLKRDLKNIIRHFRKYGIRDSEQEVYAMIKADDEAEKNIPGEADR